MKCCRKRKIILLITGLLIFLSPPIQAVETGDNVAIATQSGDQTEPSIAVNPNDPNHLIAGAIHIPSEDCRYFMSSDGGTTWTVTGLIDTDTYESCTDPVVAFDSNGNAYFSGFFYDRDANGFFINTQLGVAKSTDGGQTYGTPVFLDGGTSSLPLVDKPHIAIDNTGGSQDGSIYLAWTTVNYGNNAREIRAAVSRDGGVTFGDIQTISAPDTNNWAAHIAIEKDGNVYVAWRRFSRRVGASWPADNRLEIVKSITGGRTWSAPVTITELGDQASTANVDGSMRTSRYPVIALSPTQCRNDNYRCEDVGGELFCEASDCDVYVAFADDVTTTIDLTFSSSVFAQDINDKGQIVGYRMIGEDLFNGFIYKDGDWQNVSIPGASFTFLTGINNVNLVVGYYRLGANEFIGFVSNRAGYENFIWDGLELTGAPPLKIIAYPGATTTFPYAINDAAQIVGTYIDAGGVSHGFFLEGDPANPANYQTIDYPGASATEARDINEFGEIVGFYQDGSGIHHGFLLQGNPDTIGNFSSIDHPSGIETYAYALDNGSLIGGRFTNSSGTSTPLRYMRDTDYYSGVYGHSPAFTALNGVNNNDEMVLTYRLSGSFYSTWTAFSTPERQNVWLMTSYDAGTSWQPPVRVNDTFKGDHFDPWMCVDPKGRVHVSWLDRRDDINNLLYHTYYAISSDAGQSFSTNQRISTIASNPKLAARRDIDYNTGQIISGFIGDYIGLACSSEAVHPAWPDMRDGSRNQNIYTARISCGLQDNGDGTVTNSCTNKMWLQDPMQAPLMDWEASLSWVESLTYAGYEDWRLPRTRYPDSNCNVPIYYDIGAPPYHPCMSSELPQLANTEGNALLGIFNLTDAIYHFWSETEFQQDRPWSTSMRLSSIYPTNSASINYGIDSTYKTWSLNTWAVRDIKPSDTRVGNNIETSPAPGVTVNFMDVTAQGATTVEVSSEAPAPTPSGFEFMGNYYDIITNATYTQGTGAVTVCINYQHADIPGCPTFGCPTEEQALVIQHWNGTVWEDVTSSRDIDANVICGTADSLSWFGIARPMPAVPGDLDGDGDIDTSDFSLFIASFGSCDGQSNYRSDADYDNDTCITFIDYQIWYGYFINQ